MTILFVNASFKRIPLSDFRVALKVSITYRRVCFPSKDLDEKLIKHIYNLETGL